MKTSFVKKLTVASFGLLLASMSLLILQGCPDNITDEEAVEMAINDLVIGYANSDSVNSVTKDVTLETSGADGVTITWESSAPSVISTSGVVTRQGDNRTVTLTATLTKNDARAMKTFTLTVIGTNTGGGDYEANLLGEWRSEEEDEIPLFIPEFVALQTSYYSFDVEADKTFVYQKGNNFKVRFLTKCKFCRY